MEFEVAKEKAVRFIGISKKTSFEVQTKLKRLNISEATIKDVIDYLRDLSYIDDEDYVKAFVRQNVKMEKYSVYEIKQKLLTKGISRELLENFVDNLYDTDYEKKVIDRLMSNKLLNLDEEKEKNYIYRRGFRLNE